MGVLAECVCGGGWEVGCIGVGGLDGCVDKIPQNQEKQSQHADGTRRAPPKSCPPTEIRVSSALLHSCRFNCPSFGLVFTFS